MAGWITRDTVTWLLKREHATIAKTMGHVNGLFGFQTPARLMRVGSIAHGMQYGTKYSELSGARVQIKPRPRSVHFHLLSSSDILVCAAQYDVLSSHTKFSTVIRWQRHSLQLANCAAECAVGSATDDHIWVLDYKQMPITISQITIQQDPLLHQHRHGVLTCTINNSDQVAYVLVDSKARASRVNSSAEARSSDQNAADGRYGNRSCSDYQNKHLVRYLVHIPSHTSLCRASLRMMRESTRH